MVEKKRKKKKGRPSLQDLHKRSLKQQKLLLKKHNKNLLLKNTTKTTSPPPQSPPEGGGSSSESPSLSGEPLVRRSTRRNPNPNYDEDRGGKKRGRKRGRKRKRKVSSDEEEEEEEEEEEVEDENGNDDVALEEVEVNKSGGRKRKVELISAGSGVVVDVGNVKVEKTQNEDGTNQTNIEQGSIKKDDGSSTPLPDKKLLLFILDRLQKKDSYGVFSEPVDPEELPDYHEIIEHPMDFSTVRKKLEGSSYGFLEEFEKDIFLICSNAMQYNGSDTVYFRQASSIQELAKKNFENLRQESNRPPKLFKRPPGRPPLLRAYAELSEATLGTPVGPTNRTSSELKKGSPQSDKYGSNDSVKRALLGSRSSEGYLGRLTERFDRSEDMFGSPSKGISMKHGKRQVVLDENRRNTYKQSYELARHEPSVVNTFHGERKQLIAVGLHTQYGYSRSLAQFAAKLGPVAWKVASRKIAKSLPSNIKFGKGWVGENHAPSEKPLQLVSSPPITTTHGLVESNSDKSAQKPPPNQLPNLHIPAVTTPVSFSRVNGVNGSYGLNLAAQVGKMIGSARPTMNSQTNPMIVPVSKFDPQSSFPQSTINNGSNHEESKLPENARTIKPGNGTNPPDLNVRFQSLGSPGSGKADSVQPDLALQL